jgi:hypothetical protein
VRCADGAKKSHDAELGRVSAAGLGMALCVCGVGCAPVKMGIVSATIVGMFGAVGEGMDG